MAGQPGWPGSCLAGLGPLRSLTPDYIALLFNCMLVHGVVPEDFRVFDYGPHSQRTNSRCKKF